MCYSDFYFNINSYTEKEIKNMRRKLAKIVFLAINHDVYFEYRNIFDVPMSLAGALDRPEYTHLWPLFTELYKKIHMLEVLQEIRIINGLQTCVDCYCPVSEIDSKHDFDGSVYCQECAIEYKTRI